MLSLANIDVAMVWILSVGAPSISCRVDRISNISDIPIAPDLSSSYISNIHLNFSIALPDVGIFEAIKNS